LALSAISAGVGAYVHIYTKLLSAGLLSVLGGMALGIGLIVTPDNGKNTQLRMGFLLGFSFFSGL
jgi:hypothetical protein